MATLGRILVWLGDAASWCGSHIASAAAGVWNLLSGLLQPILSPLLGVTNPPVTWLADVYYSMFDGAPPAVGLIVTSVLTGVVMLIAFRYTSNQAGIARVKDTIKAELLAIKLYKDDLGVMFRSQGRLIGATFKLQWYMLKPLMIMLLPMLLLLAQMGSRYQQRPLRVDEATLVRLETAGQDATLSADGMIVEVGPIAGDDDVAWRVRAVAVGDHDVRVQIGDQTVSKTLSVGRVGEPVSVVRPAKRWTTRLLHPREKPIGESANVASITIDYPESDSWVYGSDWWVLTFFVVSMATAILLKPVFRVKF